MSFPSNERTFFLTDNTQIMTKNELRKIVRQRKKEVPLEEKKLRSEKIMKQLEKTTEFRKAGTVLLYWSMDDEVYTQDLVQQYAGKKNILLPAVDGDNLRIKQFRGIENLQAGEQFGIGEPTGEDFTDYSGIELIVVPGVAFDTHCNRMGRGRGYYDKLLSTAEACKIGVAFDFQIFDEVPTEEFDVKMDMVIAENGIFTGKQAKTPAIRKKIQ